MATIDLSKYICKTAGCPQFGDWAIANNLDLKWGKQKRGDIVLFDFNGNGTSDHIGIVTKVADSYIETIEGNTGNGSNTNGDGVYRRTRYKSQVNYFVRTKTPTEYIEAIIKTAESQLGYKESGNNNNKYGKWYGLNNVSWCCIFIVWLWSNVQSDNIVSKTYDGAFPTIPKCKIGEAAYNADKKSGDSKGNEVRVKAWYNFGQTHCFSFKDHNKGLEAAQLIADACANNKVGYNNTSKEKSLSFRKEAQAHNWNAKAIDKKCDTACSQFCLAGVMSTGINVNDYRNSAGLITELKKFPSDFSDLTATKYLTKCDSLYEGDILVKAKKHALMVVQGEHLRFGNTGTEVKKLQKFLNWAGFDCGEVDGEFGANTKLAVMLFQKEVGLSQTGYFGSKALKKAKEYKR